MKSSAKEPPSLVIRAGARYRERARLAGFAATLQTRLTRGRPFACLLTTDAELRQLNREFRGKDYATDVLSFPAGAAGGPLLGDIAISLDHARVQARALGHTITEEVSVLLLHGVLHLLGMDHESDEGQMRRTERNWQKKLGLPAGLIERAGQ